MIKILAGFIDQVDEFDEYVVMTFDSDGVRMPGADYFTDDREDAVKTCRSINEKARRELHGRIAAMTTEMAALEKKNRRLERMLSDARGQEEDASSEVIELYEVVICQAKRITELVEATIIGKMKPVDMVLTRHQPCGCQICICEDDIHCHGCGAHCCGKTDCVLGTHKQLLEEAK